LRAFRAAANGSIVAIWRPLQRRGLFGYFVCSPLQFISYREAIFSTVN